MKTLISLGLLSITLVITGCSNSPSTSQSSLNQTGTAFSGTQLSETTLNNSSVSSGTTSSTGSKIKLSDGYDINFGTVELVSPVYTFTGNAPEGTTQIEIIPNSNKNNSYSLKEFKPGDKEFKANFRLDYGNIGFGLNNYLLTFYLPNNEVKRGLLILKTNYKEIDLGENILYLDESKYNGENQNSYGNTGNIFVNLNENYIMKEPHTAQKILIKNQKNFLTSTGNLIYNIKDQYLLEVKLLSPKEEESKINKRKYGFGKSYTKLYEFNGKLLMEGFTATGGPFGGPNPIDFSYDKINNLLKVHDSDGDVGLTISSDYIYDTKDHKILLENNYVNTPETLTILYNNQKLEILTNSIDFEKENKTKYLGIKFKLYEEKNNKYYLLKEGYIVKDNKIVKNSEDGIGDEPYFLDHVNYDSKQIIIKTKESIFTGSLDDMGNR